MSSTYLLGRSVVPLNSRLLVPLLLWFEDLPKLEECLDASTRFLEWSVSEDLPELVEYLRSLVCLLEYA